jgi:hypothetical protein
MRRHRTHNPSVTVSRPVRPRDRLAGRRWAGPPAIPGGGVILQRPREQHPPGQHCALTREIIGFSISAQNFSTAGVARKLGRQVTVGSSLKIYPTPGSGRAVGAVLRMRVKLAGSNKRGGLLVTITTDNKKITAMDREARQPVSDCRRFRSLLPFINPLRSVAAIRRLGSRKSTNLGADLL